MRRGFKYLCRSSVRTPGRALLRLSAVKLLIVLCGLFISVKISAETVLPIVNIEMQPETVAVGEKATLRVSIFVPTWFSSPPLFPSLELVNTITRLPPDSSYPSSLKVDGETWSGIIREYEVYPLVGARFSFPEQTISAKYADPETNTPVEIEVVIPSIELMANVPKGAEQLTPYIGGTALKLDQRVEGDSLNMKVGDALVVSYTATLDGMPSIFLPPLYRDSPQAGVSSYVAEPMFSDQQSSIRTEKVTFVFEREGDIEIPGISLQWWNSQSEKIESASTDSIQLTVESGPFEKPGKLTVSALNKIGDWKLWVVCGFFLLMLGLLTTWKWPQYQRYRQKNRSLFLGSEEYAYIQLQGAIKSGELDDIYRALLGWRRKLVQSPEIYVLLQGLICNTKSPNFYLKQISAGLYSENSEEIDLAIMAKTLNQTRLELLNAQSIQPEPFPDLNP